MFQLRQSFFLFLTATIWGSGFVAQSIGMDHVTPFTYTFFRTFIGAVVLLPIVFWIKSRSAKQEQSSALDADSSNVDVQKAHESVTSQNYQRKDLIMGSLVCGAFLVGGESFQQYGLVTTDAGKAGFITSMYIVFVPIVGLFLGKKINISIVIGVLLSLIGLYLLCVKQDLTFEKGDLLILMCAFVFTFHILAIDHYVHKCDGVYLSCGQFFFASLIALILMLIVDYDVFAWEDVWAASLALLWSGVMSNGVAYTLQVVGQRGMHPTIATIILSLESVMAVIFGVLILNESLTLKEGIGCILILVAVIVAQVNLKTLIALFSGRKTSVNSSDDTLASEGNGQSAKSAAEGN
ncbi:DMT family transporter [uncultured Anaerobiospirillum sp.]|uniref:DMT family transporter n=1 Tax=uncultured Anaerobiospirillum sp. TaxID=265728 RepID=UPI0028056C2B|nr:DMT family transporter [uncultured Anaerobiospirillum sp.]